MINEKKHIMIVDDDPSIAEVIKIILEDKGYIVSICCGDNDIRKLIEKSKPDLLMLDILMYGVTGPEIVKLLKERNVTKAIPIIMMSASEHTQKIALTSGADDYLEKPFNIDYLVELVEKHVT